MTRYFIWSAERTPHEFYDKAATHGRVIEVRLHADPFGTAGMVYGSAEIDPHEKGENDGNHGKSSG